MASREKNAYIVTISGDRPIHEVAKDLTDAGFDVKDTLEAIGSITGVAHSNMVKKLRSVRGVADVSQDHPVDIGPPDSTIS
jgi:hypothetical protein